MSLANCYTNTAVWHPSTASNTKTYPSTSGASYAAGASISKFCQESDIPMAANSNHTSGSLGLRGMLCVFFFISTGIAVICATGIGEREHSARSGWHVASRSTKIAPWVIERTVNGKDVEFLSCSLIRRI